MEDNRKAYLLFYGEGDEVVKIRLNAREVALINKLCEKEIIYDGTLQRYRYTNVEELEF